MNKLKLIMLTLVFSLCFLQLANAQTVLRVRSAVDKVELLIDENKQQEIAAGKPCDILVEKSGNILVEAIKDQGGKSYLYYSTKLAVEKGKPQRITIVDADYYKLNDYASKENFVLKNRTGKFSDKIKNEIDSDFFDKTDSLNRMDLYLAVFTGGKHTEQVKTNRETLFKNRAIEATNRSIYLTEYPNGKMIGEVDLDIAKINFIRSIESDNIDAAKTDLDYIEKHAEKSVYRKYEDKYDSKDSELFAKERGIILEEYKNSKFGTFDIGYGDYKFDSFKMPFVGGSLKVFYPVSVRFGLDVGIETSPTGQDYIDDASESHDIKFIAYSCNIGYDLTHSIAYLFPNRFFRRIIIEPGIKYTNAGFYIKNDKYEKDSSDEEEKDMNISQLAINSLSYSLYVKIPIAKVFGLSAQYEKTFNNDKMSYETYRLQLSFSGE